MRTRLLANQLPWLRDPEIAAADVRGNAERGFKAVTFPENPVDLGLPSVHTDHWDPFLRACEETETVVCLHNGSSSWTAARSPGAPLELYTTLFPVNAMVAAADWLWARHPDPLPRASTIAFSEGGIGWVPMLIDRIDYVLDHSAVGSHGWDDPNLSPDRRAAPQLLVLHDRHRRRRSRCATTSASTTSAWRATTRTPTPRGPTRKPARVDGLARLHADDEVRKVTWENASKLFRHPVPRAAAAERADERST